MSVLPKNPNRNQEEPNSLRWKKSEQNIDSSWFWRCRQARLLPWFSLHFFEKILRNDDVIVGMRLNILDREGKLDISWESRRFLDVYSSVTRVLTYSCNVSKLVKKLRFVSAWEVSNSHVTHLYSCDMYRPPCRGQNWQMWIFCTLGLATPRRCHSTSPLRKNPTNRGAFWYSLYNDIMWQISQYPRDPCMINMTIHWSYWIYCSYSHKINSRVYVWAFPKPCYSFFMKATLLTFNVHCESVFRFLLVVLSKCSRPGGVLHFWSFDYCMVIPMIL